MLNLRIGGIVAGAAFVLSLVLGLVGRTPMPLLIIRPAIFAALFFVISALIKLVVSRFLPEILEDGDINRDADNLPGTRINILEGDSPPGRGPAPKHAFFGALAEDTDDDLGDISDLLVKSTAARASGERTFAGMDQNPQEDYTDEGGSEKKSGLAAEGKPEKRTGETDTAGVSGSEDALPDLDSMAGAFMSPSAGEESETPEYSVSAPLPKPSYSSRNKAPAWSGDFDAKELASGLRTILSKEKEG